jgi:exosome complex component RRP43
MFRASDFRILYTPPKATAVPEDEPDVPPQTRVAAYWTLYISVVFLSADGGLFDAAWLAILASLTQTRLPKAWWDSDIESVLCSDNPREATRLRLRRTPVVSTLAVFEPKREKGLGRETAVWVLADPNAFEEGLCKEMVTVVWDGKRVSKLLKSGGVAVGPEEMKSIVQFGARRWLEIQTTIQSASPTP